jgi:hypothetical protein
MKRLLKAGAAIALLFVLLIPCVAGAVPAERTVIFELLTTRVCTNCWKAEEALELLRTTYGPLAPCVVAYHDYPGPDPVATAETVARIDWYMSDPKFSPYDGLYPLVITDGDSIVVGAPTVAGAYAEYQKDFLGRKAIGSPVTVKVEGSIAARGGDVDITVKVVDTMPTGPNVLRVVVTEEAVAAPPDTFLYVARDILDEETLLISAVGESVVVNRTFTVDPGWDVSKLDVIAFVQDDSDKEIIQSAALSFDETSVGDDDVWADTRFGIRHNSPNPFGASTEIAFSVPAGRESASLAVYDVAGREVLTLVDGRLEPGAQSVVWDGRDSRGHRVAPGIYFCRLEVAGESATRKMVVLR